jgi:RpiR family carbohydrate utilization transcriptional regulator
MVRITDHYLRSQIALSLKQNDQSVGEIVRHSFSAAAQTLAKTPERLDLTAFEQIVETLVASRRIYFFATGRSALLASEAEYRLVRMGLDSVSVRDLDQMKIQTRLLSSEDTVFAFSHTGRNRRTIGGVKLAHEAGATTIGVTTQQDAPLADACDIALVLSQPKQASPSSRIAELALIDALATCIGTRNGRPALGATRCDSHIEVMLRG